MWKWYVYNLFKSNQKKNRSRSNWIEFLIFQFTGSNPSGLSDNYLPSVMPEEFLDGDIDRSEFDKYLSGYGANHATSVNCAFYGGGGSNVAGGNNNLNDGQSTAEQFDGHKENGAGLHTNDYILMKSEPIYETIPAAGSSLSSALADVRSVYYDCWITLPFDPSHTTLFLVVQYERAVAHKITVQFIQYLLQIFLNGAIERRV